MLAAVVGLAVGWLWFVWMLPMRRLVDADWLQRHSALEQYRVSVVAMKRMGGTHASRNLLFDLRAGADKEMVAWLIEEGPDGFGYAREILMAATNREFGNDRAEWKEWWLQNRDATQEDWIRAGFVERGLQADETVDTEQFLALLAAIGNPDDAWWKKFNASRWLRDHHWDPAEQGREVTLDGIEMAGLETHLWMLQAHPARSGAGLLQPQWTDSMELGVPLNSVPFRAGVYGAIGIPLVLAAWLLLPVLGRRSAAGFRVSR